MFAGQEKNSFDKDAGINSLNSGNFNFQSLQMSTKLYSIYQLILPESIYWTQKMQFMRNCRKIFAEVLNFLAQNAEKTEQNRNFFSEIVFTRSVSWTPNNAIFTILLQWFCREVKFYRLKAKFDRQIVSFLGKLCFAKNSSEHG